ncbi:hypothetical protein [Nostoc sp.]
MLRYWSSMLGFVPQPNLQAMALMLFERSHTTPVQATAIFE